MKTVLCAVGIALLAQQQPANPDMKYDPKTGISISKPPKNDEWDFKDKGFFDNTKLALVSKVDEIGFDVMFQAPQPGAAFDLKKVAEDSFTNFGSLQGITEAKRVEMKQMKMPGTGYPAWYLEMTCKRADKVQEFRQWAWVGRENQYLYRLFLHSEEGLYKKHVKFIDYVLANAKTWKIPK